MDERAAALVRTGETTTPRASGIGDAATLAIPLDEAIVTLERTSRANMPDEGRIQ
jgi:hypothetical protein